MISLISRPLRNAPNSLQSRRIYRRIFFSFFLLVVQAINPCLASRPVGFVGELNSTSRQQYSDICDALKFGDGRELPLARKLFLNRNLESKDEKAWALLVYAQILLDNDSVQRAKELLQDSLIVNWKEVPDWVLAYKKFNLGIAATYEGDYLLADRLFLEANYEIQDNAELSLLLMQAIAENLRYRGKLDESLDKWYEVLQLLGKANDSVSVASAYYGVGIVHYLLGQVDIARSDVQIGYEFFLRSGTKKEVAFGLSLKGLLDYELDDYQGSIEKNLEAYSIRKSINDLKGQGESLNNLALAYMGIKNWAQALSYLEEAVQLKIRAKDLTQMTVIFNNMGHCHNRMGHAQKALIYFNLALDKAMANGQMGDALTSYLNIIRFHSQEGDYKMAFEMQTKMVGLKDSLADLSRMEALGELEVSYNTQKKEQEIVMLQQKQAIITNRWLTLAVGLFFTIIIGILFVDNQKRKHRLQTEVLTTEDQLKKAELKSLADLLEYNEKKLSLYTENLLKKNELVSQLEMKLKTAVNEDEANSKQGIQLISDFSSVRILTEDDWEEFKELFNRVHHGLLNRLLASYENLTLAEQRLFLLMKLQLSTKEIANILGVSPDSVKKGRYRLKKKLRVEEATSIQDFVTSF